MNKSTNDPIDGGAMARRFRAVVSLTEVRQGAEVRLVLTDINMTGMDGLALVRALRVMTPDLRVIVSSGSDHFAKQADYAALGVLEVLAKPFVPARLLEVLQRALAEKI